MHAVTAVVLLGCVAAGTAYPRTVTKVLNVTNGAPWGDWGPEEFCEAKTYAKTFSLKVQPYCGLYCDDTSLSAIRLHCIDDNKAFFENPVTWNYAKSSHAKWGDWYETEGCKYYREYLVSFRLDVEPNQGSGDDTAANNLSVKCRIVTFTRVVEGNSPTGWGSSKQWSGECPSGSAICGIQTKIEKYQGSGDDSALNDVRMFCCSD